MSELRFSGAENYAVSYQEDGGNTYREDDVYFTERDGEQVPLDPDRVEEDVYKRQSPWWRSSPAAPPTGAWIP